MKHIFFILLIIAVVSTGIFLPYFPGDYDNFATGLSGVLQFATFASLLFVPIGLIWLITNMINSKKSNKISNHPALLRNAALVVVVVVLLAGALGTLPTHNGLFAILILAMGACFFINALRRAGHIKSVNSIGRGILPFYLAFIPLSVFLIRMGFIEKAKNKSTDFVITQCQQLIQDIEAYKTRNGHYPLSVLSTIEDYKPSVFGIRRFHYEIKGNAYNLYFEQFSDMIGTQEIVMYNRLGEQQMTVHNQDLLRIPYKNIIHGYYNVKELLGNWKIFYFD